MDALQSRLEPVKSLKEISESVDRRRAYMRDAMRNRDENTPLPYKPGGRSYSDSTTRPRMAEVDRSGYGKPQPNSVLSTDFGLLQPNSVPTAGGGPAMTQVAELNHLRSAAALPSVLPRPPHQSS